MSCPSCGAQNPPGQKFCGECGAPLAPRCSSCGAENPPGQKFCGECGSPLSSGSGEAAPQPAAPSAERRLVSVLFADLVGFTTISESRDSEEVRELLSSYFETCRRLIGLYGGTVEKFIGDAVMAVWGTPLAQEDDAERAVRAALDLVAAVPELDPALQARAGVLTGEAAVTLGASGEGMVAGDLVNTASRIQALADPGAVLVGEATKRSSEASIAYADAGSHELKGKAEPVPLWRALRVTASRRGALRTEALEPPFVGRNRELRLVKELFHASAEEKRSHLVSIVGIAGIGKSRLAWEFEKYIDGLADTVWWHRGRCLAYGEGVAYWALAEMLRMRAGISEEEPPDSALAKLRAAIEEHISDAEERSWLEPRLAHLLGLAERTAPDREDLFSGWRLFFERLAERNPTVLVFEDLQWADASLLDFVEYLLEWSRGHPLYVLALARPELHDRRPGFGAGSRNATTLALDPLTTGAMEALLDGFVPGLPTELRAQILERAEGVPLYAVETVRMLLDRGLLEREGDVYRTTGTVAALEVPETLHALLAARLDGLGPEERRMVQDASVLGKTFTKTGLVALSGLGAEALDPIVTGLVRKEIFSVQSDPRSPERGQYTFLQDLLRRVAYETLAKKERKARHLAAAGHLEQAWGSPEQEVVEVVAAHYLDAYRAAPEAEDAAEIKARARERLVRAGERAASLAASEEAQRYFEHAAELTEEGPLRAGLLEKAGEMAQRMDRLEDAVTRYEQAIVLFEAEGDSHAAARVSARHGEALWRQGQTQAAVERMEHSLAVLAGDVPDADVAALAAQLARLHFFRGELDRCAELVELALEVAEALWLPEILSEALNTKHLVLTFRGRPEEAIALLEHALQMALATDSMSAALRAQFNLSYQMFIHSRFEEALATDEQGLELARKRGYERWETLFMQHLQGDLYVTGDWEGALRLRDDLLGHESRDARITTLLAPVQQLLVNRGDVSAARAALDSAPAADDEQERAHVNLSLAAVLLAEGNASGALEVAEQAMEYGFRGGDIHVFAQEGFVYAVEAALVLGNEDRARDLIAKVHALPLGLRSPYLVAHAARFEARMADTREAADGRFRRAVADFREMGAAFWLAVALLEHAEWLLREGQGEEAQSALAEAREIFERLGAKPWLERLSAVSPAAVRIVAEAT